MTFVKVGSREDSFRNVPESVGSTCKLSDSTVQMVSTSSVLSSVENEIFTYWQSTEDISIGVFLRLAVLDGVVELSKKEPIEINGLQREPESAYSVRTWPLKAGGQSLK